MSKIVYRGIILSLTGALLFLVLSLKHQQDQRPSFIVVTIDTLRADHLEAFGYQRQTAPTIASLAERGTSFMRAFSASNTTAPSHASIFTGLLPMHHSIKTFNRPKLDPSETTLAEIMSSRGYATCAVVSNPVLSKGLGLDQGFDTYDANFDLEEAIRKVPRRSGEDATRQALGCIQKMGKDKPFFLWVHYQDIHGPYTPDARFVDQSDPYSDFDSLPLSLEVGKDNTGYQSIPLYQNLGTSRNPKDYIRRYDGAIRSMDAALKNLVKGLEAQNFFSKSYLILTADHGEALGDNGFFFSHGSSPFQDQTHVPLLVVGPKAPIVKINRTVSNASIFPTVLELADIAAVQNVDFRSLVPYLNLNANELIEPKPIVLETPARIAAVVDGLILARVRDPSYLGDYWRNGNVNSGGGPVLPIVSEAISRFAVPRDEPESLKLLRAKLEERRFQSAAAQSVPLETRDRETLEKLRTLGYFK